MAYFLTIISFLQLVGFGKSLWSADIKLQADCFEEICDES